MNKLLLASLQIEYETTDINIDDLCLKHKTTRKELKGYTLWNKRDGIQEKVSDAITDIITEPIQEKVPVITDNNLTVQTTPDTPTIDIPPVIVVDIKEQITTFKEKAMKEAIRFMDNDMKFAEVKEFKDMVAIVDSIDKSLQKDNSGQGQTINIMVQNLTERYKDDC